MMPVEPLSDRERACLYYAAQDKSCQETATLLQLSQHTVRLYRKRVLQKLGCKTMGAALVKAIACGVLSV